jgi:inosose dehydratase
MRRGFVPWLGPALLLAVLAGVAAPMAVAAPKAPAGKPVVAAQLYVWTQHFRDKGSKLEDNLDEALAATAAAGFPYVQGWLDWFATDERAAETAARLAKHKVGMKAAYTGGQMHDEAAAAAIAQILERAARARKHGLEVVVMNPAVKRDGAEKTDAELDVQARSLDALGEKLRGLGLKLAIHTHDKEMRSDGREWHHILAHTKAENVGFCLDLHWIFRGGQDPLKYVQAAGARTHDLHLRNSRKGVWQEGLGDGDIDYRPIAKALAKLPYRGHFTVELAYEKGTEKTRSLGENLKRSRAYVKKIFGK